MITKADTPLTCDLHASPNFEPRARGSRPNILLLHYTGMASARAAIDWLASRESRLSCHYVIDEAGRITQLVAEAERAWHAGIATWGRDSDINSLSIGIEIHNPGHELGYPHFPPAQIDAVIALSKDICARHGIPPQRVLAHSDVAPTRKIDPGERFPWARLAAAGVGHWVEPVPHKADDPGFAFGSVSEAIILTQDMLRKYGYNLSSSGDLCPKTDAVVKAFQRHFRPGRVDGRIDQSTISTLERLIAALPMA